jgi:hypothetical protein
MLLRNVWRRRLHGRPRIVGRSVFSRLQLKRVRGQTYSRDDGELCESATSLRLTAIDERAGMGEPGIALVKNLARDSNCENYVVWLGGSEPAGSFAALRLSADIVEPIVLAGASVQLEVRADGREAAYSVRVESTDLVARSLRKPMAEALDVLSPFDDVDEHDDWHKHAARLPYGPPSRRLCRTGATPTESPMCYESMVHRAASGIMEPWESCACSGCLGLRSWR